MKRVLLLGDTSSVDMVNERDEVEKMEDKRETQEAEQGANKESLLRVASDLGRFVSRSR